METFELYKLENAGLVDLIQLESQIPNIIKPYNEGILLSGLVLGTVYTLYPEVGSYIKKAIEIFVIIIKKAIEIIKKLYKEFIIFNTERIKDNSEFIARFGNRLNRISDKVIIVPESYKMNSDINILTSNINLISQSTAQDLRSILYENKSNFDFKESMDKLLIKTRAAMVEGKQYDLSLIDDTTFRTQLINKYMGEKKERSFTVKESLDVITSYTSKVSIINSFKNSLERIANRDIDEINKIYSNKNAKINIQENFSEQLRNAVNFRTKLLSDTVLCFEIILNYVNSTNLQAKAICIKAMEEN